VGSGGVEFVKISHLDPVSMENKGILVVRRLDTSLLRSSPTANRLAKK
jgi:hypothetical protein